MTIIRHVLPTLTFFLTLQEAGHYLVELRFEQPDNPGGIAPVRGLAEFDFAGLRAANLDPHAYGKQLTNALFTDPRIKSQFDKAWVAAQQGEQGGGRLRLILLIDPGSSEQRQSDELHNLRWETLTHPDSDEFLFANANYPFSRFLESSDWSKIPLRPRGELAALVIVANPSELQTGKRLGDQILSPVDVKSELQRVYQGLKGMGRIDELTSSLEHPGIVNRETLLKYLRDGYDILYLVCHGALLPADPDIPNSTSQPIFVLENSNGRIDYVEGEWLIQVIKELDVRQRPRLIVLSSCQSGGSGQMPEFDKVHSTDQGALAALGPRLAMAGVPAVVAMQHNILMKTAEQFMPIFFEELGRDGQLDRALALARSSLKHTRPDWWVPVLYTRLKDGRLWMDETDSVSTASVIPSCFIPIPSMTDFIGREVELDNYRKRLSEERIAIITGMEGVGKTYLGVKLAREIAGNEKEIFWFNFNRSSHNTCEALLWALAEFLYCQGWQEPWRYFNGEIKTEKSIEISSKLALLLNGIEAGDYVICIDEFEVVKDDLAIVEFFHFIREKGRKKSGELPAYFILIGKELPPEMDYLVAEPLEGFSEMDAQAFMDAGDVNLSGDVFRRLYDLTEGNPMLLRLSITTIQPVAKQDLIINEMIQRMAEEGDVRDFLMNNILVHFDPDEKETLDALSIFSGPVDRKTASGFLYKLGIRESNERITTLLNKWILNESVDGSLSLHRMVREYCYRMLEPNYKERFNHAAAEYFQEIKKYLFAGYHFFESGDQFLALDTFTNHVREIVNNGGASALREQLNRFEWSELTSNKKATLSQAIGDTYRMEGKYQHALAAYEEALVRIGDLSNKKDRAELLYEIGMTYYMSGNYMEAICELRKCERLSDTDDALSIIANAQCAIGWAYYRLGKKRLAERKFKVCRESGYRLNDDILVGRANLGLGLLALEKNELQESEIYFEKSYQYFHDHQDMFREVEALINLGWLYSVKEDLDQEKSQYHKALELAEQVGDVHNKRMIFNNLGNLHQMLKEYDQAENYYNKLAELANTTGHRPMLSTAHTGLADAFLARGDLGLALDHAGEALRVAEEIGHSVELAASFRVRGDIYLAQGKAEQAHEWFEKSIPILEDLQENEELAKAQQGLANIESFLSEAPLSEEEGDNG